MSSNDEIEVGVSWEVRGILYNSGLALMCGVGAAAAASIKGVAVMTGMTMADVEAGLDGTRLGRTLAELFAARVMMRSQPEGVGRGKGSPVALMIAVQSGEDGNVLDAKEILRCIREILDRVTAAVGVNNALREHFAVTLIRCRLLSCHHGSLNCTSA
jgi:hypothetical protein